MSNSSIWSLGKTLSDATLLGRSGRVSYGNEGVIHIPHQIVNYHIQDS